MTDTLSKVDSANNDNFVKATAEEVKKGHRRASSMAADVYAIEDLGECADTGLRGCGEGKAGLTERQRRIRKTSASRWRRRSSAGECQLLTCADCLAVASTGSWRILILKDIADQPTI
jgi:hypothetical protein